jgi:PmbA protein
MKNKILNIAEKILKQAQKKGAEQAEIYITNDKMKYLTIELGEVKFRGTDNHTGLGLTVSKKKALGTTYSTKFDDENINITINDALKIAKVKKPDPDFIDFPDPKKSSKINGYYDKNLANFKAEDAVSLSENLLTAAHNIDPKVIATFGVLELHIITKTILNTSGINVVDEGTLLSIGLRTMVKAVQDGNGYDFQSSRSLRNISPEKVGESAGKLALESVNAKKIESQKTDIILDPHAAAGVFSSVLGAPLFGNMIQENRSVFTDMIGHKVGSASLTVFDDGRFPDGYGTARYDDEGVPTQKTMLIEEGVLQGYLYNTYYASKVGLESTGNAIRTGNYLIGNKAYRNPINVGLTNLIIQEGEYDREELIGETKKGILLTFAVGGGSPVSGDFSSDARNAFMIEKGEITYPIKQGMYTGNILESLQTIIGLSKERRFSGGLSPGRIYTPSIKISNETIIGG